MWIIIIAVSLITIAVLVKSLSKTRKNNNTESKPSSTNFDLTNDTSNSSVIESKTESRLQREQTIEKRIRELKLKGESINAVKVCVDEKGMSLKEAHEYVKKL